MDGARPMDYYEFEEVLRKRQEFNDELAEWWQDEGLTALVSPVWPHVAPPSSLAGDVGLMIDYTMIWNVTGNPAGVLPATRVLESEQDFDDGRADFWTNLNKEVAKDSKGMPVSVQVIGFTMEDEKVLAIMKRLEAHFKYELLIPAEK